MSGPDDDGCGLAAVAAASVVITLAVMLIWALCFGVTMNGTHWWLEFSTAAGVQVLHKPVLYAI